MKKIFAVILLLAFFVACAPTAKKEVQIEGLKSPAALQAVEAAKPAHGGCMGDPHAGDGCGGGCKHGHDQKGCGEHKGCGEGCCKGMKDSKSCADKKGKEGPSCGCGKK